MTITISTAEILHNVRRLAHIELESAIPDETARYKVEPGSEKLDELKRILLNAFGNLTELLSRFLVFSGTVSDSYTITNAAPTLPEDFTFSLDSTSRRMVGKAQSIGSACFSYLTNAVLVEYYSSIALPNLVKTHAELLEKDTAVLNSSIYTKTQP